VLKSRNWFNPILYINNKLITENIFKFWRLALLLKIHGYYFLPEGKKFFLDISDTINKRYSRSTSTRNTDEIIREIFERSQAILAKDSPFDVKANIPHMDNVRKLSIANRSLNPIVPGPALIERSDECGGLYLWK